MSDWLANQRASGEFSIQTSNYYTTAIKGFCRWLVRNRRTNENPLTHLEGLNAKTDKRIERRSLSDADFAKLVQSVGSGQPFRKLTGFDRRMLYLTAAYTGFRASELRSLTPSSFDLDGELPTVTVAAGDSKRRNEDAQPIRADLADELREYLRHKPNDAPVWPGTWNKVAARMLRMDLDAAKLPFADDAGRVFDFHAFRHQYISSLAAVGIHPKIAQQLARHSTITLTMDRYTHLNAVDVAAALDRLPSLPGLHPATAAEQATGTDGRLAPKLARTIDAALRPVAPVDATTTPVDGRNLCAGNKFGTVRHRNTADAEAPRKGPSS